MKRFFTITLPLALFAALAVFFVSSHTSRSQETAADKKAAIMPEVPEGYETATFASGCYWCVEAVFQQIDGVDSVTSGFTGGHVENPRYESVGDGNTGHAEAVRIIFDPKKVSYETLLSWFWKSHDPTQLNRQGADIGTHYRSGIFYHNDKQKAQATASRTKAQKNFSSPIVTELTKVSAFYPAKVSHQDYYRINGKKDRYCRLVIEPKLEKLKLEK